MAIVRRVENFVQESAPVRSRMLKYGQEHQSFRDGHQWDEADRSALRDAKKPCVTLNLLAPFINVVAGTEVNTRQRVQAIARHPDEEGKNTLGDLCTNIYEWAIDRTGIPDERSCAFLDTITVGIGWMHFRMDYDRDLDGVLVGERVPWEEMGYDPYATQQNLGDARYIFRRKQMSREDIVAEFGQAAYDKVLVNEQIDRPESDVEPKTIIDHFPDVYREGAQDVRPGRPSWSPRGMRTVTEAQWWELEPVFRVQVPEPPPQPEPQPGPDGQPMPPPPPTPEEMMLGQQFLMWQQFATEQKIDQSLNPPVMTPAQWELWEKLAARLAIPTAAVKQKRRKYMKAFVCGSVVFEKRPLEIQDNYTYRPITCFYDPKEQVFYGMVRNLMDPQRIVNKYQSLGLGIFGVNPKGAVLYETGAVTSPKKFEENWGKPGSVIQLNGGGLNQIKVVDPPPYPEAISTIVSGAIESFRSIAGINIELLGMSEGDQPALLMRQRQNQAMTILAPVFNALRRYREQEFRVVMAFVREFMADGRVVRVGGLYNSQVIPLMRDKLSVELDLTVDENPFTPNQKAVTWEALQQIMPTIIKMGIFPPEILDFAPVPAAMVEKLKQYLGGLPPGLGKAGDQPDPEVAQLEKEDKKADIALKYARARAIETESAEDANLKRAQAAALSATTRQKDDDLAIKQSKAADELTKSGHEQALNAAERLARLESGGDAPGKSGKDGGGSDAAGPMGDDQNAGDFGDETTRKMTSPFYPKIR